MDEGHAGLSVILEQAYLSSTTTHLNPEPAMTHCLLIIDYVPSKVSPPIASNRFAYG